MYLLSVYLFLGLSHGRSRSEGSRKKEDAHVPDVDSTSLQESVVNTPVVDTEAQSLQEEYAQNKRVAMAAFEKEWETSHQPRLERSIKRARRTQLTAVRTALDEFEKCL